MAQAERNKDARDLVVIVIDLTPTFWGMNSSESFNINTFIQSVLAFANVQLMLSPLYEVAIIGVTPDKCKFLCPSPDEVSKEVLARTKQDGQCKMLAAMNDSMREKAVELMHQCSSASDTSTLAGAIIKGLCYYLRRCRELHPTYLASEDEEKSASDGEQIFDHLTDSMSARILVMRAAEDNPSQYLSLMNVVFTAQKLNVPIDVCVLPSVTLDPRVSGNLVLGHSNLLQQAADLTGGLYLQIPRPVGLLQYLVSVFLPRPNLRPYLLLPNNRSILGRSSGVDFRAACFCHRKLVDIGYVCSLCLSVFCEFTPLCSTCGTQFSLPFPQPGSKISTPPTSSAKE